MAPGRSRQFGVSAGEVENSTGLGHLPRTSGQSLRSIGSRSWRGSCATASDVWWSGRSGLAGFVSDIRLLGRSAERLREGFAVLKEFKDFITRGNIIGLAIGLVLAVAFGDLIKSFVDNFVAPIVGSLSAGGIDHLFRIHLRGANYIQIGTIITAAITFIATAAAVFFFIIKPMKKMGYNADAVEL